ncbi:MAG: hypothetical protein JXK94_13780 [Deltaproteobacteria bacterium]|nr:hypothetical protein [Deltaproteobacteria bacterium]
MNDEPKLVESPLSQAISSGGRTVKVEIYRAEDEPSWVLEVVDEYGNSTVWDDTFPTDSEALTEVKKTILADGIASLIGPEDGKSKGDWK